ncbi:interleukin-18-like [Rhinatrema bivittatum]|uniref:interleukin-18-like n=1 Tax=Rhinatrema bivittatum TaxID=194408 RepID=UPI00112D003B|nr:interleukin-18-like [Rhinatrema bivittatum]
MQGEAKTQPASSYTLTANKPDVFLVQEEDGVLYFHELQVDSWKTYNNQFLKVLIENSLNDTLLVYPESEENCAVFRSLQARHEDDCSIKLHEYRDTSPREGISVAFTVQKGRKSYLMNCTSDRTLEFQEGNAPSYIPGDRSEYIFYQKFFSEGDSAFSFESSLLAGYFLASKEENGLKKLALKKSQDQVDDNLRIQIK